ncbi:MAG TPA: hypothetical protein DCP55_00210 [Chitinophagaceae bacterium]|nr:hypothetical protein [Chitinophagaceae bacterium]
MKNIKNACFKIISLVGLFLVIETSSIAQLSEDDKAQDALLEMKLSTINLRIIDPDLNDVLAAKVVASQLNYVGNNKQLENKWTQQKQDVIKNLEALEKALEKAGSK